MPGRKPVPTSLKLLHGNPGKRKINSAEPKPTGVPSCPKHLSKVAKAEWKRISAELITLGLLTSVDRAALAAYCAAYARWAEAEEKLQQFGTVIKTKNGNPVQSPFVGVANRALELMHKFLTEFGMTPASRTRLQVQPMQPDADDEFWANMLNSDQIHVIQPQASA